MNVDEIRRIEDDLAIFPSPFLARGFVGLARFGGEPLSVFSRKALAEGGPCVRRDRMTVVVVEIGRKDSVQRMGLAVDEVLEILAAGGADSDQVPITVVSDFFDLGGRQVRRFNIDALQTGPEGPDMLETTRE